MGDAPRPAIGYLGALGGRGLGAALYFPVDTAAARSVPASAWPWAALLEALWRHDALYWNRFDGARVRALGGALSTLLTCTPSPCPARSRTPQARRVARRRRRRRSGRRRPRCRPAGRAARCSLLLRGMAAGWCLVLGLASLLLLGVTLLPLSHVAQREGGAAATPTAPRDARGHAARSARPRTSNSYGVFRRMTGVGC